MVNVSHIARRVVDMYFEIGIFVLYGKGHIAPDVHKRAIIIPNGPVLIEHKITGRQFPHACGVFLLNSLKIAGEHFFYFFRIISCGFWLAAGYQGDSQTNYRNTVCFHSEAFSEFTNTNISIQYNRNCAEMLKI